MFRVLSQNPSQVILENVEGAGEQVECALGRSRIMSLSSQHFYALALARNNAPRVGDMAKSHLDLVLFHRNPHDQF